MLALIAAPTVFGARPVRTVVYPTTPFVAPAGTGCAFDVQVQPVNARVATTVFGNGTVLGVVTSDPVLTNLSTGASIATKTRYFDIETTDAATNTVSDVADGMFKVDLYPGDQGPYGVVAAPGLWVSVVGHLETTFDLNTGAITHFSLRGQVTGDICAALSH